MRRPGSGRWSVLQRAGCSADETPAWDVTWLLARSGSQAVPWFMRARRRLAPLTVTLAATFGCGGDLTLPGDNAPTNITVVSGDGQEGRPGKLLGDPLVVEVTDAKGRPSPGTAVAFRFVGADGSPEVDPATGATDEQGRASTRARLGETEGEQTIEARVASGADPLTVRFKATALAGGQGGPGGGDKDGKGKKGDKGGGEGD